MANAEKLISTAMALTILTIFIFYVAVPISENWQLAEKDVYKMDDKNQYLDKDGQITTDPKAYVILKKAVNFPGVHFINQFLKLIPLFLSIGGIYLTVNIFKRTR